MKTETFPDRQEFWTLLHQTAPARKTKGFLKVERKKNTKNQDKNIFK